MKPWTSVRKTLISSTWKLSLVTEVVPSFAMMDILTPRKEPTIPLSNENEANVEQIHAMERLSPICWQTEWPCYRKYLAKCILSFWINIITSFHINAVLFYIAYYHNNVNLLFLSNYEHNLQTFYTKIHLTHYRQKSLCLLFWQCNICIPQYFVSKWYKIMRQKHLHFCNSAHLATMYFKLRFHIQYTLA